MKSRNKVTEYLSSKPGFKIWLDFPFVIRHLATCLLLCEN